MAKWIFVLSVAAVLTRIGMADIMVQPGYQSPQHHSIITQPHETMQHLNKDHLQQPKSADYHLEFHPVYTDSYQIPANALYPVLQHYQVMPQLYGTHYSHPNSGDVGLPGMHSSEYVPLPVHSRYRRSSESNDGEQSEKRDKLDAVATKSSLDENVSPVIDLRSLGGEAGEGLDEKNVKVRQSDNNQQPITSNTLFGLNPANMYPTYQQYQFVDPALNSNQEFRNIEMLPEGTVSTEPASEYREVSSAPLESPQTKLENLQHAMLLQHPGPEQQQQSEVSRSSELRNFPDPRPSSATLQSPEADTSDNHSESRAATRGTKFVSVNTHKKLGVVKVGYPHNTKVVKNYHHHAVVGNFRHAPDGSHPSVHPAYTIHQKNDGMLNNFATNSGQQEVQVYQLPNGQATTCLPASQYTILPQTYGSNYVANYALGSPSSSSTYQICVHNPDNLPFVMYQLP
ncbi:uncharacterized protein LOC143305671 [Osmia lignaria lignaria]|uniref:uncharacterized protein LOC143305671 n=1 Tax=Osmia lignaria lignaria TaxID=1437193 RepID=UPI00402BCA68